MAFTESFLIYGFLLLNSSARRSQTESSRGPATGHFNRKLPFRLACAEAGRLVCGPMVQPAGVEVKRKCVTNAVTIRRFCYLPAVSGHPKSAIP